jgi:phenylpropionate dioxygenase-like ring-hydroxylating dioxygenase large terminal subunit
MIPRQWYVVLDTSQVKDRPVGVTRLGEKLVFWRDQAGKVACLRDRCAHRGVQLSLGKVAGGRLCCPFHGLEYDASGRVTVIPANGKAAPVPDYFKAPGYPAHEAHGFIWVWWGEEAPVDLAPPAFFDNLDTGFSYGRAYDPWPVHYSRVIENQLDAAHLPFVHHNTIGRGNRRIVDGPVIVWPNPNKFYVYVHNRVDDGNPPISQEQLPAPDPARDLRLEFIFPNLWQNRISDELRILAAFVPVDGEHTLLYLRFYQKFMRAPGLRRVINALSMPFNLVVAHQDRRVVATHQPKASGLQIGEKLFPADRPVVEYRRRRQELIDQSRR